jgi:hypothetical protein
MYAQQMTFKSRQHASPVPDRPNNPVGPDDDTDDDDDVPATPPTEPEPVPIEDPKPDGQPEGPYIALTV